MARIRSVKPEFWSSPNLPEDPWARLLYIAMWNWADDNGVGTANPRELLGFAFPNDEHLTVLDLRRMLVEIRRVFGVKFYEVAERPYYAIPSWEAHQKFDRRSKGKYPGPEEAESQIRWMKSEDSTESHESPSSPRSDSVAGTGEQGNRGTGISAPAARVSESEFENAWQYWPKKVERKKSLEKFRAIARRRGVDVLTADIRRFGEAYARTTDKQFVPALNVWLNGERWTDELPGTQGRPAAPEQDIRDGIRYVNGKPVIGGPNGMTPGQYDEWRDARAAHG